MYNLKITELTAQRDMQSLVKLLLKIPGLKPDQVSTGLRIPPLDVLLTEKEDEAQKLKSVLEKFGAVCLIENTENVENTEPERKTENIKTLGEKNQTGKNSAKSQKKYNWYYRSKRKFGLDFWLIVFATLGFFAFLTIYVFDEPNQNKKQTVPAAPAVPVAKVYNKSIVRKPEEKVSAPKKEKNEAHIAANNAKINNELKKDLVKNPYNASAWKTLAENLEKQGDTLSANTAKESYEKAVKAQLVLASLAKAFGNEVRVEITENAVYYRSNYNFTDEEFYAEAEKLRDSLDIKFPGKSLVVENYTPDHRFQKIQLK